jgi:hypothetical protein
MTAANTELVRVPEYLRVVGAILRLAAPLLAELDFGFDLQGAQLKGEEHERVFKTWKALRLAARQLCERCACQLSLAEAYELRDAVKQCPASDDRDFLFAVQFTERG